MGMTSLLVFHARRCSFPCLQPTAACIAAAAAGRRMALGSWVLAYSLKERDWRRGPLSQQNHVRRGVPDAGGSLVPRTGLPCHRSIVRRPRRCRVAGMPAHVQRVSAVRVKGAIDEDGRRDAFVHDGARESPLVLAAPYLATRRRWFFSFCSPQALAPWPAQTRTRI